MPFTTGKLRRLFPVLVLLVVVAILIVYSKVNNEIIKYTEDENNSSLSKESKTETGKISLQEFHSLQMSASNNTKAHQTKPELDNETNSFTTTMTFDRSLVVGCRETPFVQCPLTSLTSPVTNFTGHIFNIALFRTPEWQVPSMFNFSICRYNNCRIDSTLTQKTDVVLYYAIGLSDRLKPPQRWNHQLYGIYVWESPVHTNSDFMRDKNSIWNNLFNITITYRTDSDVFVPYYKIKFNPKPVDKRPNYYELAKSKTRTAVWFVSNCDTPSKRENYVKEMQKYIDVDIFGGCGQKCGSTCNNLYATYRFYLAFENSLCNDYITEKFFKLFNPKINVIPVVRGGADYDKYFPNFTYINAAHFKTPKDLALHLKDLASNLEMYSKYLEYKDLYECAGDQIGLTGCALCEFLHKKDQKQKSYDLNTWVNAGQCHGPKDI